MLAQKVDRPDRVSNQVQAASGGSAYLMAERVAAACERAAFKERAGDGARLRRLVESGAWTEAALALVETELPGWQLRRLIFDDGKWLCSLSRQAHLPLGMDDSVEATHEVLPLAILEALVEARCAAMAVPETAKAKSMPAVAKASGDCLFAAIPCDNFS